VTPRQRIQEVRVGDINAHYPNAMLNHFPDMKTCRTAITTEKCLKALIESDDVVCWANLRLRGEGLPAFLPSTDELGRRCWTNTDFDGWLCEPEIAHALELGYEIVELKELHYAQAITPFTRFVTYFYELRKRMKEAGDGRQLWIKIMLASLYGKFGQKEITERIENDEKIEEILSSTSSEQYEIKYYDGAEGSLPYLIGVENIRKPKNSWFGFCAFTTSYARVTLNRAILSVGEDAVYCDTDSLFFKDTSSEEFLDHVEIGKELGQWDWEMEEPTDFIYFEPKAYVFLNPDGSKKKVRHKGVTTRNAHGQYFDWAGDLTREQIRLNVVQYRTAMKHGLLLGSGQTQYIHSHRHYGEESPFNT
jgi:DNA polymerase elongation subunit (family B)